MEIVWQGAGEGPDQVIAPILPEPDIEDFNLQDIAGLSAFDRDRTGQDMSGHHPFVFGVNFHQFGRNVKPGGVGQDLRAAADRVNRHLIAAGDGEDGLQPRFKDAPVTGLGAGMQVLGGGIDAAVSAAPRTAAFTSSSGRIIAAAALAHRYPNARIIYSGGTANLVSDDTAKEADYVLGVFESLGVSRGRIISERLSRNTFENAEFSKELAAPKNNERWLLVTSAYHMPRSIGIFRKIGFAVEPYPADWRLAAADLLKFSALSVETLAHTDIALREWTGLAAYRISGKTNAFFPGPNPE